MTGGAIQELNLLPSSFLMTALTVLKKPDSSHNSSFKSGGGKDNVVN